MRKLVAIIGLLLLAAVGVCAQQGVPPGGYNQNGGTPTLASIGSPGPWMRLDQYGYVGDIRAVFDAVANSTTLVTSATAAFTPADTGKIAWVVNDGTHATQCSTGTVTYVSATSINLSTTCAGSGSAFHLYIGTNNYAAWVAACNAVPVKGATIYVPGPGAVFNSSSTPFCTLANTIIGDVTIWGDYAPLVTSTGSSSTPINGNTVYIGAGYTYTNGGSGDFIADSHAAKIHLWDWGIDGGGVSTNVSNQALLQLESPDIQNFMMIGFNNTALSGYMVGWVGDNDNSIYNSYFNANGFGALFCNGFNTALIQVFAQGGAYAYQQSNGCQTDITGGVFIDNSTSGSAAVETTGACGVVGLCKMSINGNAYICGVTGIWADMTSNGSQIALDGAAVDTNNRCALTNQTAVLIAATNRVMATNSDLGNAGTGYSINNAGTYTSSGGNYNSVSTGAGVYHGAGSFSLSQNDWPAPLTSGLSGFGSTPSVTLGGNVLAFSINVGTGGTAQTGTITFAPAAPNGWQINACWDITTQNATVSVTKQIGAGSTTQVTIGDFTDLGAAGAWASGDVLVCQAAPY